MRIPKPPKRFVYHHELHHQMKTTHPTEAEFSRFKSFVRESSKYLKLGRKGGDPTPRQWRNLIEMVLLEDPSLSHYEDHWPIRHYALVYIRSMWSTREASHRHRYSQDLQRRSATKKPATVLNRSRRNTVPTVIDLEVIELTSREGTPSLEARSPIWKATNHTSHYSSTHESRCTQVVSEVRSSTPTFTGRPFQTQFPLLRNEGLRPHKSHLQSKTVSARTALCCLCGPPVEIDSFRNNRLAQLIGNPCTLKTLQSFGICFDQHLDFLVCLDEATQLEIVDLIPLEEMNALAKFKLLRSFKQLPLNNFQEDGIPQSINPPSKSSQEYVVLLANSKKFRDWLQKAMALEHDDAIFQDLLRVMETHSTRLFIIEFPVIDHLRATIRAIVDERPMHFRHYPAYWPIRLYLNYRQEMLGCTTPQYDSQREEEAFSDVFNEQDNLMGNPACASFDHSDAHEPRSVVTVEQVPCRKHPPINIVRAPAALRTRLHALGVAELLPALVHIGIRTERDMQEFCRMNAQERKNVMDIGKLKLGMLQKYMLELLCKRQ